MRKGLGRAGTEQRATPWRSAGEGAERRERQRVALERCLAPRLSSTNGKLVLTRRVSGARRGLTLRRQEGGFRSRVHLSN